MEKICSLTKISTTFWYLLATHPFGNFQSQFQQLVGNFNASYEIEIDIEMVLFETLCVVFHTFQTNMGFDVFQFRPITFYFLNHHHLVVILDCLLVL